MARSSPSMPVTDGFRFGILAKFWQAGAVKTRLSRRIGEDAAAKLHREFVRTLFERFRGLSAERVAVVTPTERQGDFAALAGAGWQIEAQVGGDLGERMAAFFHRSLHDKQARRVVLIGSDSPTMPVAYVEEAFELLGRFSVVLGPSDDGGYYLVGAAGQVPAIFQNVAWSTPQVWEQTVRLLHDHQVPFAELPPWYDVDEEHHLRVLEEELMHHPDGALHELYMAIRNVLGS